MKILIVDDHKMFRTGLGSLINAEEDMEVVGEAADGIEAIEAAQSTAIDVVIMDLSMPGMNGIEAMRRIRHRNPETRIIILSIYSSSPLVKSVMAAGASAYVLKGSDFRDLVAAIRRIP